MNKDCPLVYGGRSGSTGIVVQSVKHGRILHVSTNVSCVVIDTNLTDTNKIRAETVRSDPSAVTNGNKSLGL